MIILQRFILLLLCFDCGLWSGRALLLKKDGKRWSAKGRGGVAWWAVGTVATIFAATQFIVYGEPTLAPISLGAAVLFRLIFWKLSPEDGEGQ